MLACSMRARPVQGAKPSIRREERRGRGTEAHGEVSLLLSLLIAHASSHKMEVSNSVKTDPEFGLQAIGPHSSSKKETKISYDTRGKNIRFCCKRGAQDGTALFIVQDFRR